MFGLITRIRHEREMRAIAGSHNHWQEQAREWEAKFKKAITDLAAARERGDFWVARAEEYRAGHEANERRLKRDRDQKAAKRAAKQDTPA